MINITTCHFSITQWDQIISEEAFFSHCFLPDGTLKERALSNFVFYLALPGFHRNPKKKIIFEIQRGIL